MDSQIGEPSSASAAVSKGGEFVVNGKYRLIRKIGSGSFGDIYLGINISNGEVSWKVLTMVYQQPVVN